ncbi:MAG: M1 family metallopeptidase, partial [Bacteroidota bacterium]
MQRIFLALVSIACLYNCSSAQQTTQNNAATGFTCNYWQQHVDYTMNIDMNVDNYQYSGDQTLIYTNNSSETLDKVYYHLFFNAFQPGSKMDVRSRNISDPDSRVGSRINTLKPNEIGYLHSTRMTQDGTLLNPVEEGTILIVPLAKPLMPGASTVIKMDFEGQVPKQIRRSGRNNKEGVALSMTQWFPKMAEFDRTGWNTSPYIAREFHGVFGDYDVKITIDKNYMIGGSGYLQNPKEVGHGYDKPNSGPAKGKNGKLTWHFKAPMVHDFAWAADTDFVHDIYNGEDGVKLHFLYKDNIAIKDNWKKLQPLTNDMLKFFNENIGKYPYKQYSVIQGGDGGMEYAMCTLITGERQFNSLVGVTAHEFAHSWFQHVLATDESKHEWMDEGFTTYISNLYMNTLRESPNDNPNSRAYSSYRILANSGKEEPQTTHADRFDNNFSYGIAAYNKGAVFVSQLGYVVGDEARDKIIKEYYNEWKFKHPDPNDFKRVAERLSGMDLEWYLRDWTMTTKMIDYSVDELSNSNSGVLVSLSRKGAMAMPLDIEVTLNDGSRKMYYIPLEEMRGEKDVPRNWTIVKDWTWAYPNYELALEGIKMSDINNVTIDPKGFMA